VSFWVIRAGRHGEQEDTAFKEGLVCHSWNELPDYSSFPTKDDLRPLYVKTYPSATISQVNSGLGQVWRFAREIQQGDLVALPLKAQGAFSFGRVTGEYQFKRVAPNVMHIRRVEWLKTVPRSVLPEGLLRSMNSMLTVFKVDGHDAEIDGILGRPASHPPTPPESAEAQTAQAPVDLEETARDEILLFIQSKFKGHDLARLVDAVLRAQGYKTEVSRPGPDGGVDILAGSGPLGLDQPRLCVQVKSGSGPEGQKTYNELHGVVSKFDSGQGLFVSWGGFTQQVKQDARKDFFKIRLWNQVDLVDAILQCYEHLDEDIRGELPLKRIWVMVAEPE